MRSHPLLPPIPSSTSSSHYFFPSPAEAHVYHPKPTLYNTASGGAIGAAFGTVVSAIKNATQQHDKGAIGVFTRTGSSITFFAALVGTYAAAEAITSNVRATEDPWNGAVGGCAAGFIAGIQRKSLPVAVGQCAFMGTVIGAYQTAGVDVSNS
ncbi:Tim17/Tim22/Tim23/Pmp24 family-domain-containing protein [Naematelia encephala]|uniref:Tim17/Tim22/Tim23/Pmp24 family-domain-containing protein n=1 Tax=Naematelia encephala TaxID=71784 RepID=A0A1Y2B6P3_9TREE|nr:Tim17/Tim22/Tim23/Pmp24 family-domain-containing protein [Naematelia encephala]